jgi:ankyrin repeat protein
MSVVPGNASPAQRRRTRNYIATWFAKRRSVKRVQSLGSELLGTRYEGRTGSLDLAKQSDGRNGSHASGDNEPGHTPTSRPEPRGHDYRYVNTKGHARVHLGNTYVEQQNIFPNRVNEKIEKKKQNLRDVFMANLSFEFMESRLTTISVAQPETCSWLFATPEYHRWRESAHRESNHGFLWIKGKPGAGKSTIMKHALRYAQTSLGSDSSVLSFFFNARGYGLEKSTEGMYRSMLHQLYSRYPERLPEPLPLDSAVFKQQGWPVPTLQNMLRDALLDSQCEHDLCWYIDALDECEEDEIRLAVRYFETLAVSATTHKIKLFICFASRHYPHITISKHETINLDAQEEHRTDIAIYITKQLCGASERTHDLGKEILQRSSGVFLWAVLVVLVMNKMMDHGATRSQLLAELAQVPDGISGLLENILRDREPSLLPTLQWMLFSMEVLGVDELYFAVKTSLGHLSIAVQDAAGTSQEQKCAFILSSSKGLVEIKDDNSRAQFIHESVREYLLSGGLAALDPTLAGNVEAKSHARLAQWCHDGVKTLNSMQTQWWSTDKSWHHGSYPTNHMLIHMEHAYAGSALDLLSVNTISRTTWDSLNEHAAVGNASETATSLYSLIRFGCTGLAGAILERQISCVPNDVSYQKPLHESLDKQAPLAAYVDVNALCGSGTHDTALLVAIGRSGSSSSKREIQRVIQLLLKCGADPNGKSIPGYTPLLAAMDIERHYRHKNLVKLLLQHGADPNVPTLENLGHSLLAAAVHWDSEGLVKLLLQFGANVGGHGETRPLCLATACSSPSIVRVLLAAGASVNDRNESGRTALHQVCLRYEDDDVRTIIAQDLLDAGADLSAVDDGSDTALTLASRYEQRALVRLFLDQGADLHSPQHRGIARGPHTLKRGYTAPRAVDSASSNDCLIPESPTIPFDPHYWRLPSVGHETATVLSLLSDRSSSDPCPPSGGSVVD